MSIPPISTDTQQLIDAFEHLGAMHRLVAQAQQRTIQDPSESNFLEWKTLRTACQQAQCHVVAWQRQLTPDEQQQAVEKLKEKLGVSSLADSIAFPKPPVLSVPEQTSSSLADRVQSLNLAGTPNLASPLSYHSQSFNSHLEVSSTQPSLEPSQRRSAVLSLNGQKLPRRLSLAPAQGAPSVVQPETQSSPPRRSLAMSRRPGLPSVAEQPSDSRLEHKAPPMSLRQGQTKELARPLGLHSRET